MKELDVDLTTEHSLLNANLEDVLPPPSNTGAISTQGLPYCETLIVDWFEGTFLRHDMDTYLALIADFFGDITPLEKGGLGYTESGVILGGKGRVYWHPGRSDMGVHLSLPGSALGLLASMPGFTNPPDFLGALVELGLRPSRIDLALDDRAGLISIDVIKGHVDEKLYTSRWRKGRKVDGFGDDLGRTVYFGRRVSETLLRIYDKAAEQGVDGHWIRVEIQIKSDKAVAVCERLFAEGPGFVPGLIRGYLEFKMPSADTNRTRWPAAPWWAEFLSNAEKVCLALPPKSRSIEKTKEWIRSQVAPSMALVTMAEHGCVDWLYESVRDGHR